MNYATERLLAAATASLAAWQDEVESVRGAHRELIDELEGAIHYFNAHGATPATALYVGDLAAVGRAVELARQFVDDWAEDAKNEDEETRGELIRAELQIAEAEQIVARLEAPEAPAPAAIAALPAIKALIGYVDDAPAIVCEEGYWDDQESACFDGMNQARSEAAALIRPALTALGIEAPAGLHVCSECYRNDSDGCSSQCSHVDEEEEEAEHCRTDGCEGEPAWEGHCRDCADELAHPPAHA